jgi:hypothetical protein
MADLKLKYEISKPSFAQGKTVRKAIGDSLWNKIRAEIYEKDNHSCVICGYSDGVLHAHEVFEYDEERFIIKLVDIQSLCVYCHNIKHFYFTVQRISRSKSLSEERQKHLLKDLREHFKNVNQCTDEIAIADYRRAQAESGVLIPGIRYQEAKGMFEHQKYLRSQKWFFSVPQDIPFHDEVITKLKKKGVLYEKKAEE